MISVKNRVRRTVITCFVGVSTALKGCLTVHILENSTVI